MLSVFNLGAAWLSHSGHCLSDCVTTTMLEDVVFYRSFLREACNISKYLLKVLTEKNLQFEYKTFVIQSL